MHEIKFHGLENTMANEKKKKLEKGEARKWVFSFNLTSIQC